MLRAVAASLICAVLALTAAACGGQAGSGGDADPASLVPARASVYLQTAVQPQGERRDDALAALKKIMRTDDPGAELRRRIDAELAKDGDGITWERDLGPWLGEDAGVWASGLEQDEPDYAVIVATKDAEAARAAIGRLQAADGSPRTKRSYDGLPYEVDDEDTAVGLVDDFVVIGTEAAFKRTADTRQADSLADVDRYRDAVDDLEDGHLAHWYVDARALFDAAVEADPTAAQQLAQVKAVFPLDKLGPLTGSFHADGEGLRADSLVTGVPDGPMRRLAALWSGDGSDLLGSLPGDAWGSYAVPRLGAGLKELFTGFAGAIGGAAVTAQVQSATGLDLQQDVFSWMGDVGVFVRGEREADLNGAVVIETTDDARAAAAFGKFVGLLGKEAGTQPQPVQVDGADSAVTLAAPGSPQPVVLARGKGRVVAAVGTQAAADALDPDAELSDAGAYDAAEKILGDGRKPSFLVDVPAVLRLAQAMGAASDPDYESARPYLETLGAVTSGGKLDGDRIESRLAVTLK